MYSVVNGAALVRDLARREHAAETAVELLRALGLDRAALDVVDQLDYDETAQARRRATALTIDDAEPRALTLLAEARAAATDDGLAGYASRLDVLERATLGGARDLVAFVRRELLAECWSGSRDLQVALLPRALDVVSDGVLGAWTGDADLAAPWREICADLDIVPARTAWPKVADVVRRLDPDVAWPAAPAEWAVGMHDATWAVHLTGRGRSALVAQLHALLALLAVTGPRPPLRAVATVVAAAQADVVVDVLDTATYDALTQPLFRLPA
jgi:hypothetical protein